MMACGRGNNNPLHRSFYTRWILLELVVLNNKSNAAKKRKKKKETIIWSQSASLLMYLALNHRFSSKYFLSAKCPRNSLVLVRQPCIFEFSTMELWKEVQKAGLSPSNERNITLQSDIKARPRFKRKKTALSCSQMTLVGFAATPLFCLTWLLVYGGWW